MAKSAAVRLCEIATAMSWELVERRRNSKRKAGYEELAAVPGRRERIRRNVRKAVRRGLL